MKANTQHGEVTEHVAYFANSEQPRFIEPRRCELPIIAVRQPCLVCATEEGKRAIANRSEVGRSRLDQLIRFRFARTTFLLTLSAYAESF